MMPLPVQHAASGITAKKGRQAPTMCWQKQLDNGPHTCRVASVLVIHLPNSEQLTSKQVQVSIAPASGLEIYQVAFGAAVW